MLILLYLSLVISHKVSTNTLVNTKFNDKVSYGKDKGV